MKGLYYVLLLCGLTGLCHAQHDAVALVESDKAPTIDGVIDVVEWAKAIELTIHRAEGHNITVLVTYDAQNLYVAFQNLLTPDQVRLNTEVLVHTQMEDLSWNAHSFWFHASYGNCAATGQYYYWEDCTNQPIGWMANTFPFQDGHDNIEFKISFSKLNISPTQGHQLKIAFKVSDPLEQHAYWPEQASIADPTTWGTVTF